MAKQIHLTHFMNLSQNLNILLAQSQKTVKEKMKSQDYQNQKFNYWDLNPKPTNINKDLKNCRKLNSDNLPNDVDRIFNEK